MLNFAENVATDFHTAALLMADEIVGNMQRAIEHNVSENLKQSVRKKDVTSPDGGKVSVLIVAGGKLTTRRTAAGSRHDYSMDEEFGNVKESPRPFFFGTYRAYIAGGLEFFKETLQDTIDENNKVRSLRDTNYNSAGFSAVGRGPLKFLASSNTKISTGYRGAVVIQKENF